MKKDAPNCSAPQGLPHGRTPSWISFDHSKACMPTKDAPRRAVANISAAVFFRSRRYPTLTAIAIVPLLLMRTKVMIAIRIRDRKRVVWGKRVYVRVDLGGR